MADEVSGASDRRGFGMPTFLNGAMSVVLSESAFESEISFTGQHFDALTSLYLFRNRYFDSTIGQFITRDPLAYPDGPNSYAGWFAPSLTDPLGLAGKQNILPSYLNLQMTEETVDKVLKEKFPNDPSKRAADKRLWEKARGAKGLPGRRSRQSKGIKKPQPKRPGCVDPRFLKYLFLTVCETSCANAYYANLDAANDKYEDCLDGASSMKQPMRSEQENACGTEINLSFADAAITYTACGPSCLLPF